ncbi:MAG TPA: DUF4351 domain-containing protein [Gemmataceae bacterium]|jgi:hypothetical protein|nr:DUF4351 domain-containing protein [Gemmataceae bacterium]
MDHDQRFKTLIQAFFGDFLQLFFASWAQRLDCAAVEWLDKEVFPDPPEGPRRVLDLVAKVPTRQAVPGQRSGEPEHWLALVHIEIESPDKATPLRPRMFRAYVHLRDRHELPVLPIALYLQVGLDGIGIDVYEERFWELQPVHFEYLYVGLPALDAVQYVEGENWLGVALAALMRIPPERAAWLGAEALRRLKDAPLTEQRRFLLGECVQAYLPLNEEQRREFDRLLATGPYRGVQAMNITWYERGVEKGVEKGQRELLREQLEERFGPLSLSVVDRLEQLPADRLKALGRAMLRAQSLRELGLED